MATTLVDEKYKKYQDLQADISKLYAIKTSSLAQYNENTLVKGELDLLEENSRVYKLVGPVLMAVDLEESKGNVEKRLEFIEAEIKKIDNQVGTKQGEQTEIGGEIAKLQSAMQADAARAANEVVAAVNS